MASISLQGMTFYGYHGFYDEERIIGGHYTVDVELETDFFQAAATDDLAGTINYETIYQICAIEMERSTRLIETIAERIATRIKQQFSTLTSLNVRISKHHPPLGGPVHAAVVATEGEFGAACPRCKKNMICYGDTTCWCGSLNVLPATQTWMSEKYSGCLCEECLGEFMG